MRSGGLPPWTAVRNCWSFRPPSAHLRLTSGYCDLNSLIRLVAMSSPLVQSKPMTLRSPFACIGAALAPCDAPPPEPEAAGDAPPPPEEPAGVGVAPLLHAATASRTVSRTAALRARGAVIGPPPHAGGNRRSHASDGGRGSPGPSTASTTRTADAAQGARWWERWSYGLSRHAGNGEPPIKKVCQLGPGWKADPRPVLLPGPSQELEV